MDIERDMVWFAAAAELVQDIAAGSCSGGFQGRRLDRDRLLGASVAAWGWAVSGAH